MRLGTLYLSIGDRRLLAGIRREASRLKCDPRDFVVALLVTVVRDKMIDNILDGDRPEDIATPYQLSRRDDGLTARQQEIFGWLTAEAAKRQTDELSCTYQEVGDALGFDPSIVFKAARSLERKKMITVERPEHRCARTVWKILPKQELAA
ncbi:hypothetical protein ASD32_04960 [Rhizobium sp. Root483D2]|nr:hypothetical protein ASD32_04960 [Rhizobium sp. Root483D2]